jgi:uncharacterized glyoxalase superfamily protein PhnB
MRLDVYVNYRGNCEEAFRFYERHLGGRITGIVRHREQPNPSLAADWQDKVIHARIEITLREPLRDAARCVRHVLDASPSTGIHVIGSGAVRRPPPGEHSCHSWFC